MNGLEGGGEIVKGVNVTLEMLYLGLFGDEDQGLFVGEVAVQGLELGCDIFLDGFFGEGELVLQMMKVKDFFL